MNTTDKFYNDSKKSKHSDEPPGQKPLAFLDTNPIRAVPYKPIEEYLLPTVTVGFGMDVPFLIHIRISQVTPTVIARSMESTK